MRYFAQSQLALRRNAAIVECWSVGKIVAEEFYFITPLLRKGSLQQED
jgi:hypothetical protein